MWRFFINFNTSNVTIQLTYSHLLDCPELISIHLMLLFNVTAPFLIIFFICISIHLMLLFNSILDEVTSLLMDFNTSNVTIQHVQGKYKAAYNHISIHLMLLFNITLRQSDLFVLDFNTSNVTIQPKIIFVFVS